ncbi:hypothetical protein [Paraburkholderia nemoris]|uniref:hypothetical protein n=1 Tax=Paraburkholderia nemoris TaxID=2793076 RepID=UPI0038B7FE42
MRDRYSKDIMRNAASLASCREGEYVPLSLVSSLLDENRSGIFDTSRDTRHAADDVISAQLVTCDAPPTMSVVFYCCNFLGRLLVLTALQWLGRMKSRTALRSIWAAL